MELFKLFGTIAINNSSANQAIDDTGTKAQKLSTKIGSAAKTVGSKMADIGKSVSSAFAALPAAMETAGTTITNIGKKVAPASATLAAAMAGSTKSASDFKDGMAKMSTLFDTSQTSVKDLSKEFLNLSGDTGLSADGLAEAGYQALSAGQDVSEVGKFVKTAGNLAKAGFTSTTTAVDVLTTAINAYGSGAGTADEISNKLVRTQNLGKTTVDELASSMGKIIPTASAMGVNIDNLSSGYVSLTKQGIATAEATTYMNSMFNELGDSGTTLGGVIEEKTGMSFQDCMKSGMSLADVLQITKQYADDNGIAYNELWSSAEAGKAGLAILNGGVDEFNSTVSTMADKTDDVGQALEKLNTPSAKAHKAINRIKNSGIELGTAFIESLTPTLEKVCGVVEKATTWFDGLDDHTKTMIATAMAVGAVASPILVVGGKMIKGIGSMIGKIQSAVKIVSSLSKSMGGLSKIIGAVTSPVGIAIVAIVALVAAGVLLYKNWDTVKEKLSQLMDHVKKIWEKIRSIISEKVEAIRKKITNIFDSIKNYVKSVWDTIENIITVALMLIGEIISAAFQIITLPFQFIWENCKEYITAAWEAMKNVVSAALDVIKNTISTVWNAIASFLKPILEGIKNTISTAWNAIKSTVSMVLSAISSTVSRVWNAIASFLKPILDGIRNTVSNAWNAIKSAVSNAMSVVHGTVSSIMNSVKSTFSSSWNGIKSTVSNAVNGVKSTISSGLDGAKSTVSNVLGGIKSKFTSIWDGCKEAVRNAIDKIKSATHFSWSLPHLKVPVLHVTGKFGIAPPSVPHFSIEWHKKAMDNPMLLTQPTAFGINKNGQIMAGGEAGDEVVSGKDTLMAMIEDAVGTKNSALIEILLKILDAILALDENMGGNLRDALAGTEFKVNNREFARLVRTVN